MQASTRNVCIFTYSHLSMLLAFGEIEGKDAAEELLHEIFKSILVLNPSKESREYWCSINKTMLSFSRHISGLWQREKKAVVESIALAKEDALTYLSKEREKIMRMSHEEALAALVKTSKIESKVEIIKSISSNNILGFK